MYPNEHEGYPPAVVKPYHIDPKANGSYPVIDVKTTRYQRNPITGYWQPEYLKYKINYLDSDRSRILVSLQKHEHASDAALKYADLSIRKLQHDFDPRGCSFVCQRCGCARKDVRHAVGA